MGSGASIWGIPLKWISLVLMVTQMVGMVFILRVSRTIHVEGSRYLNTTAICVSEALKFLASLTLHLCSSRDLNQSASELWAHTGGKPVELLKTCLPSLLYTLQNNLLFIGLSHLSAGAYQVTYQFKILTTAGLSVIILGTKLSIEKWFALLLLTGGVILVNTAQDQTASKNADGNAFVGLAAVGLACITSGLAGVYLEKILKQTTASLWIRNMQLGFFGTGFGLVIAIRTDGEKIQRNGFLQGYTLLVWAVVVCQAIGGLLVAAVMKYADNILKCFGCAIAIVFTCILSVVELQEFEPDFRFVLGTALVLVATAIYSLGLPGSLRESFEALPVIKLVHRWEKQALLRSIYKSGCVDV